ncbi:MAG: DUF2153 family protein [Ignisphaera sp.]
MSSMYDSLTQWIEMQKKVKEWFGNVNENAKKGDRLELILYTRMAFQHMIRTLKAFDNWLQDPFIISNMPKEELEFVWTTVYNILQQLIDLDIKHTSEFRDYISKLEKEGKLNPLLLELFSDSGRRRRGEREGISLSI